MNLHFQEHEASSGDSSSLGRILIEAPHWTAGVGIFDDALNAVSPSPVIYASADSASGFFAEGQAAAGVYLVRMTLDGKTQETWAPVQANKTTYIDKSAWDSLKFTSSVPAPAEGRSHDSDHSIANAHLSAAEKYSRTRTCKSLKGNSQLFVFIRRAEGATSQKDQTSEWTSGLQLLTTTGVPIQEFVEETERDEADGWAAFSADLPEGGYILRQGKQGLRLRYHVIYLCPYWQTQVFIKAKRHPLLRSMSLSMSRIGAGFRRDDESDIASEAVLKSLKFNSNLQRLFRSQAMRERLDFLIDEKLGNPWLGVIAAHAIMRLSAELQTGDSLDNDDQDGPELREYIQTYEAKILPFLARELPSHPDVFALGLSKEGSGHPFAFPPSLWVSLRLAQTHASKHSGVIPPGSLTDCIIDNLIYDSPWTSWRHLDRRPDTYSEEFRTSHTQRKTMSVKRSPEPLRIDRILLGQDYVLDPSGDRKTQAAATDLQSSDIQQVAVSRIAKEIGLNYINSRDEVETIPEHIQADTNKIITEALDNVSPQEVSESFDLPLDRTEQELENLKRQTSSAYDPLGEVTTAEGPRSDLKAQNAILQTATGQAGGSLAGVEKYFTELSIVRADEVASKVRSCAERLWMARTKSFNEKAAEKAAIRLKDIFEELLRCSTFLVVTDANFNITARNEAFMQLLIPKDLGASSTAGIIEFVERQQRNWQAALSPLGLGDSIIPSPSEGTKAESFRVKKSLVQDELNDLIHAYTHLIRKDSFRELEPARLDELNKLLPDLALYSSLFTYGTEEDQRKYLLLMVDLIDRLETVISR